MAQVYLAPGPFGAGGQFFDANGKVLNGGLINTYAAGGTTPTATYTTSAGSVANANPIVLNTDGRVPAEVWLIAGTSYKFTLTDSLGNLMSPGTFDNLSGIGDPVLNQQIFYITGVAGTNTITGNIANPPTALAAGQVFRFIPAATNTGAVTLNAQSLGAKSIFFNGVACVGNELVINVPVEIIYDGTQFNIIGGTAFATVGVVALTAAAGTNTVTATSTPAIAAYLSGQKFVLIPAVTNTGATTLNVNSLGAKSVFMAGVACAGGDLVANVPALLEYDGTQFNIIGPGYSTGTWTPAVGGSATYTTQTGTYTKIGRLVTVQCYLVINVIGTGSSSAISGLPFQANATGAQYSTGAVFWSNAAASFVAVTGVVQSSTSSIIFFGAGAAAASITSAGLMGNGTAVSCTVSYIV